MKHLLLTVLYFLSGLFFAQDSFSLAIKTSEWTYSIRSQSQNCEFVKPADSGTFAVYHDNNKIIVVSNTNNKSYTATYLSPPGDSFTVHATYPYLDGYMTEYITLTFNSDQITGTGSSSWEWTDGSGNYYCAHVNGVYQFDMTRHNFDTCYEDFGVEYCCHIDNEGIEYCCHVDDRHPLPNDGLLHEQCCSNGKVKSDGVSEDDWCSYVIDDLPYKWGYFGTMIDRQYWQKDGVTDQVWMMVVQKGSPTGNSGALSGQVSTSDGRIVNVKITTYFYPSGQQYKYTIAVGSGSVKSYVFGGLIPQSYYIKAAATGYNVYTSTISILVGETLVHDITLTPLLLDNCPNDPNKTDPGTCGCGVPDTDTDFDGIPDCLDSTGSGSANQTKAMPYLYLLLR